MITVNQILAFKPCKRYTEKRLIKLIDDGATNEQLCDAAFYEALEEKGVFPEDILWALHRLFPDLAKELVFLAADRAVRNYALKCGVKEVEKWAEKWLSGENRTVESAQAAVRAALWTAAWAAARAAGAAARAATEEAVWAAAETAVEAAARAAVGVAAGAAAMDAERRLQIKEWRQAFNKKYFGGTT